MDNIVRKSKEFMFLSQSINPSTAADFWGRVNGLLDAGWDVFASQSIGLDTGGGQSGGGNVMMVVTLVKYEYIKLLDTPSAAA